MDVAGDVVTEDADAGIDTVKTALAAYTLADNVENLTYVGTVAFTGTGNSLANTIRVRQVPIRWTARRAPIR